MGVAPRRLARRRRSVDTGTVGLLDHYPLDWTDPRLRHLQDVLVAAIHRDRDIEQIVIAAGVPPGEITLGHLIARSRPRADRDGARQCHRPSGERPNHASRSAIRTPAIARRVSADLSAGR
jgi:hypothetical protein